MQIPGSLTPVGNLNNQIYVEIDEDENNKRHTEPAFVEQETVHIADTISEIRPNIQAEHKGTVPENRRQNFLYRRFL